MVDLDEEARVKHRLQCRVIELEAALRQLLEESDGESYAGALNDACERARKMLYERVLCSTCAYPVDSKVHKERCGSVLDD